MRTTPLLPVIDGQDESLHPVGTAVVGGTVLETCLDTFAHREVACFSRLRAREAGLPPCATSLRAVPICACQVGSALLRSALKILQCCRFRDSDCFVEGAMIAPSINDEVLLKEEQP
jgi:hypothetical protein